MNMVLSFVLPFCAVFVCGQLWLINDKLSTLTHHIITAELTRARYERALTEWERALEQARTWTPEDKR